EFTFPDKGEMNVELRGDFSPGAWQSGVKMTKDGAGVWRATLDVPLGRPIQYQFVVNGTDWRTDPAQELTADKMNNQVDPVTCATPSCAWDDAPVPPAGVWDWRDSVLYFVFVDRFADGRKDNNCGPTACVDGPGDYKGGDWAGVTAQINGGY